MTGFRITRTKGFHMTFKNGWTISVQFGSGNYCENKMKPYNYGKNEDATSEDAEIAIWDKDDKDYDFGYDTVKPYCSADEVAEWIEKVRNF